MTTREATRGTGYLFLWVWSDQVRARLFAGQPYNGNIDAGEFRPQDDPHPHSFVVCQVERCLQRLGSMHAALAWHLYVNRKPLEAFRHADLTAESNSHRHRYESHLEIVDALTHEIGERTISTLSSRAIAQAQRRLKEREPQFAAISAGVPRQS